MLWNSVMSMPLQNAIQAVEVLDTEHLGTQFVSLWKSSGPPCSLICIRRLLDTYESMEDEENACGDAQGLASDGT